MNITRSSVKLGFATAGTAITTFVGIAYFARLLSPSELGVYFIFEALLGVLVIPADFGLRGAVQKRISEGHRPDSVLTTAILLKIVPLAVVGGLILLFAGIINDYSGLNIAKLLVVAIIAHELYQLFVEVLRGELRVGETAELRLTERVVWLIVGVVLIKQGFGITGVIYGKIAGFLLAFIWGYKRRLTSFGRPSNGASESLISYSKFNFISAASGYIYSWVDILAIGFFLTAADVGAYETAWRVTAVGLLGSKAISVSIFPKISQWDAATATGKIEEVLPKALTGSLMLIIPGFFGAALLAEEIMTFVFGADYAFAWPVLIILMGEKVFRSIHDVTGRSLKAIDYPGLAAKAALSAIIVNIILNAILVWQFGLVGAAFATITASLLNTAMCIGYLSGYLEFKIAWGEITWLIVSSTGMSLFVFGVNTMRPVGSLPGLLVLISIAALVYAAIVLSFSPLRKQAIRSLNDITGKQVTFKELKTDD